jgi:hypothetical protein
MPPTVSHRTLLEPKSLRDALKMLRDEGRSRRWRVHGPLRRAQFRHAERDAVSEPVAARRAADDRDARGPAVHRRDGHSHRRDAIAAGAQAHPDAGGGASEVGGVQIQNRGTLGGNIANASPAGDTLPALAAADASVC